MPAVAAQSRALVRRRLPCKSRESLRARGEQPGSASDVPACRIPRGAVHFSHYTSRNLVVPSTTSCLGRAEEHPGFAGGPRKKFLSRAFWKGIYHVTWHVAWVAGFPGICVRSRDSAPLARNRRSRGGARGRRRPPREIAAEPLRVVAGIKVGACTRQAMRVIIDLRLIVFSNSRL